MRQRRLLAGIVTVVAVTAGTLGPTAHADESSEEAALKELSQQTPSWEPCYQPGSKEEGAFDTNTELDLKGHGSGYARAECATIEVPLDWADPAGRRASMAISRLRASDQDKAGKNPLFYNPGGPGLPGRWRAVKRFVEADSTELPKSMDIIGFDPRGTGASTPRVNCGDQWNSIPILYLKDLDMRDLASPDPARKKATQDAYKTSFERFVKNCKDNTEGLEYVTTQQTIRDIDLLREVLGYSKTNWLGFSAGTALGAYYAAAYPNRVGRFVLDSVVNPRGTWAPTVMIDPEEGKSEQASLELLAANLAKIDVADDVDLDGDGEADDDLGSTEEEVLKTYEDVRSTLPRKVGTISMTKYKLDEMIRQAMYSDTKLENLAKLWVGLREAAEQDGPADDATIQAYTAFSPYFTFTGAQYAVRCQDTQWPKSAGEGMSMVEEALKSAEQTARKYPYAGWKTLSFCMFWDAPTGESLADVAQAPLPPMLLVNSKTDHVTPLSGAREMLKKVKGSQLITVDGGNHSVYLSGNHCVDRKVEAFLLDGTLPSEEVNCPLASAQIATDDTPGDNRPPDPAADGGATGDDVAPADLTDKGAIAEEDASPGPGPEPGTASSGESDGKVTTRAAPETSPVLGTLASTGFNLLPLTVGALSVGVGGIVLVLALWLRRRRME
ncbi:alpha/beta hydrolase [Streptomyces wuyuanensis]|uniref:alpha/beta hydrolase n=1 Tax=Streptomyces wuyuanensis TaxID=1196353 RepID=UPI00343F1DA9